MLINDIEQLKSILGGIQKAMNWPTWKPYVEQATLKHLIPAIGQELYDDLTTISQPTDVQKELLTRLKTALAYFAYMEALPFLATAVGDAGLVVNNPSNTASLPKWLYVTIGKQVQEKSDSWLEASLQYLETHVADFPTWEGSAAFTISRGRLVGSATELTRAFPAAKNSRRLFLEIRGYLLNAEEDVAVAVLGEDFYAALQTKLLDTTYTFTPKESKVLKLCREAISNRGFMKAIPFVNLNADFRIVSETDGIVNEGALDTQRMNVLLNDCQTAAANAMNGLTAYLNANASTLVFPEYLNSPLYRAPSGGSTSTNRGESTDKFFVL